MKKMMITSMLPLTTCLVTCCSLSAEAQGVHLSQGDTLAIGFNGVDGCHFTEGTPPSAVAVAFGIDLLEPGESLRLDMFENSLNDPPLTTGTFSPATALTFVELVGPSAWLDFQGAIRVTMLSGSVDVNFAHFTVGPNPNRFCDTTVFPVPEPSAILLMGLGGVVGAVVWIRRRMRNAVAGHVPAKD